MWHVPQEVIKELWNRIRDIKEFENLGCILCCGLNKKDEIKKVQNRLIKLLGLGAAAFIGTKVSNKVKSILE